MQKIKDPDLRSLFWSSLTSMNRRAKGCLNDYKDLMKRGDYGGEQWEDPEPCNDGLE